MSGLKSFSVSGHLGKQLYAYAHHHKINVHDAFDVLGLFTEYVNPFNADAPVVSKLPGGYPAGWADLASKSPCQCQKCEDLKTWKSAGMVTLKMDSGEIKDGTGNLIGFVNSTGSGQAAYAVPTTAEPKKNGDYVLEAKGQHVVVKITPSYIGGPQVQIPFSAPYDNIAHTMEVKEQWAGTTEIVLHLPQHEFLKIYNAYYPPPPVEPDTEEVEVKAGDQILLTVTEDGKIRLPKTTPRTTHRPVKKPAEQNSESAKCPVTSSKSKHPCIKAEGHVGMHQSAKGYFVTPKKSMTKEDGPIALTQLTVDIPIHAAPVAGDSLFVTIDGWEVKVGEVYKVEFDYLVVKVMYGPPLLFAKDGLSAGLTLLPQPKLYEIPLDKKFFSLSWFPPLKLQDA